MKVKQKSIERISKDRGAGFRDDVLRLATCEGAYCEVPNDVWLELLHKHPRQKRNIGLGDIVRAIAQPIAKAIDSVAHTNIQNCGGCKKRREILNRIHL